MDLGLRSPFSVARLGEVPHYPGEHCPRVPEDLSPRPVSSFSGALASSRTAGQPLRRGDGDTEEGEDDVLPVPRRAKPEEQALPPQDF